jgi:preprotein translocase subunit YajC
MHTIAPYELLYLQGAGTQASMFYIVLWGGLAAIFYFLVLAPQNKQRKQLQELINSLKKGDKVLTTGGIYGTVQGVEAEVVYLKIAENVKVKVARSAISGVVTGDAAAE